MKNTVRLKVCGMKEPQNMLRVAALAPDYMGFIFFDRSPRYVGSQFAIPETFPSTIKRVGVFVNASSKEMLALAKRYRLDYLQLHGDETPQQAKELKNEGLSIIKVFSVADDFDFAATVPYEGGTDFFLFDTKGKYRGGNATVFDWSVLERYHQRVPFFLGGGLSPENVSLISSLEKMNLHALDVNSGVEIQAGLKDPDKIIRIQKTIN